MYGEKGTAATRTAALGLPPFIADVPGQQLIYVVILIGD
jgi:hypothetical protein